MDISTLQKVEIEWIDSKGITSLWEYIDEIKPLLPVMIKTSGYLIDDNLTYKTIANSVSNDQVAGRITIPAVCIKKITVLG